MKVHILSIKKQMSKCISLRMFRNSYFTGLSVKSSNPWQIAFSNRMVLYIFLLKKVVVSSFGFVIKDTLHLWCISFSSEKVIHVSSVLTID